MVPPARLVTVAAPFRRSRALWRPKPRWQGRVRRRAGQDAVRLSDSLAHVPKRLEDDPDVHFFLQKNPRWAEGDELCCLARADDEFVEKTTRIFL